MLYQGLIWPFNCLQGRVHTTFLDVSSVSLHGHSNYLNEISTGEKGLLEISLTIFSSSMTVINHRENLFLGITYVRQDVCMCVYMCVCVFVLSITATLFKLEISNLLQKIHQVTS